MPADVQREAKGPDNEFIVSKLCKHVSTLHATLLAKLLREKRACLSPTCLRGKTKKNESTRPTTQSIGPVLLLRHKSQVMLHKKTGGEKD